MILFRVMRILFILGRHRLDRNLPGEARTWKTLPIRLLAKLFPKPSKEGPESARLALESLGPIFIKFGQLLSTRGDLFSENMATELAKLQDQVCPFSSTEATKIIEASLGADFHTAFTDFDAIPLASASLAQVHTAKLIHESSIKEVVIKVRRPNIETTIKEDIQLMYFLAKLLERFWSEANRLHPVDIVRDYERTILEELDLRREAEKTVRLRENWLESGKLYVPEVFEQYCGEKVMVMERIHGVTANDISTLTEHRVDLRELAHLGVEIFFTQVFEDNFFHADMHPGNVFIDISNPSHPKYIALDCAIIGSLTEEDIDYLARNLVAFFRRDYEEVAKLHVRSSWVPPDTNISEFADVIRRVVDPFFQKPIKEISFGTVLLELFRTARQFKMEVQPQLILLQKTLINIEGMGRQIYPDLDLWETAAPFMERWMAKRLGLRSVIRQLAHNSPRWLEQLPEVPDLVLNTLREMKYLTESSRQQERMLIEIQDSLTAQNKKNRSQRLGGLAMLGAILSMLWPASGLATFVDPILSGSILGSLGVYWMYIHS